MRNARRLSADQLASDLQRSKNQTARVLEKLAEHGLVVAQGSGKNRQYLLSPDLYHALGQHAELVRQAGFASLQQIEMIKNYIREKGSIKREQASGLCRISPKEAGVLLGKLKNQDVLELHGTRRGSHYTLK